MGSPLIDPPHQKEEELRKEEERKKALDARLRFEQERMEQERLEQEERERRYREREEQIEEHRHGWGWVGCGMAAHELRVPGWAHGCPSPAELGQGPAGADAQRLSRFPIAGGSSRAWRRRRPGSA